MADTGPITAGDVVKLSGRRSVSAWIRRKVGGVEVLLRCVSKRFARASPGGSVPGEACGSGRRGDGCVAASSRAPARRAGAEQ